MPPDAAQITHAKRDNESFRCATRESIDTTLYALRGDYTQKKKELAEAPGTGETGLADPALLAVTDGSLRDHCADLTAWILALATTP